MCVIFKSGRQGIPLRGDWRETSASEFKMIQSLNHGLKIKNGK